MCGHTRRAIIDSNFALCVLHNTRYFTLPRAQIIYQLFMATSSTYVRLVYTDSKKKKTVRQKAE
jgi:hypothetical protein